MSLLQITVATLQRIEARLRRSIIVVPESVYMQALLGLACRYMDNAGRTAWMDNGQLVSVVTPMTTMNIPKDYDLYLCGWGSATVQDEMRVSRWIEKARHLYVEVN